MTVADLMPLADHLWQSTVFAGVVWVITLMLRNNRASVRHRLWLAASIKFLVPFSVLVSIGSHFQWRTSPATPPAAVSVVIGEMSQPFAVAKPAVSDRMVTALLLLWLAGVVANIVWWFIRWFQLHRIVRNATPLKLNEPIPVKLCLQRFDPGVFGIFRPVLLLPEGIRERLSPEQFQTVVAHELCHVRRRDNLAAAVHLFVEALFWFHPLVWWIKARLLEEQERACDEEVLKLGNDPQIYAETILRLCEFCLTAPLICAAGMMSSNLKKRIEEIMGNRVPRQLSLSRQVLLAVTLIAVLFAPFIAGAVRAKVASSPAEVSTALYPAPQPPPAPLFSGPSPQRDGYLRALGSVIGSATVAVKSRVEGQLMSVSFNEGERIEKGQLLASIDARAYQIQLEEAQGQLSADQSDLAARVSPSQRNQLQARISSDQARVDTIRLQIAYSEIRSPIAGISGLRLIDPGNIVRPSDNSPIVVITQVQPIAVLFNIPEDNLSQAMARLRSGSNATVEAWDHNDSTKLATGRLAAADNQIDTTTGTVKLKALFDNQDYALFPNQFVNVRLLLN